MHFDETREAYLAEFDRLVAEIREDLADPKFRATRWDRDGFPFVDLVAVSTGVASLNGLQNNTENAAAEPEPVRFLPDEAKPIAWPQEMIDRCPRATGTPRAPASRAVADPIEATPVAPEAVAVDAAPPAEPAVPRLLTEDHYRDMWRAAKQGIRTDWDLIGEEAREEWRVARDEAIRNCRKAEPPATYLD